MVGGALDSPASGRRDTFTRMIARIVSHPECRVGVLAAALLVGACAGEDPVAPGAPVVMNVVHLPEADTIFAVTDDALVVEVRDAAGVAVPQVLVRFLPVYTGNEASHPEATTAPRGSSEIGFFVHTSSVTTDSRGRAAVQVRLGPRAPVGRIRIHVGTPGVEAVIDTVALEVRPGRPVAVRALPEDTSVYHDRSLRLRGGVVDRHGNLRDDLVTYQPGPSVTVSPAGIVQPTTFARTHVVLSSGAWKDTTHISVVPRGRILGAHVYEGGAPLVIAELDGSFIEDVPMLRVDFGAAPTWTPDGRRFIYSAWPTYSSPGAELFISDSTGIATRLFPEGTFLHAAYPRRARQDDWLYFSAQIGGPPYELWRSHADGSARERLGIDLGGVEVDWRPDPSPTNSHVAFTTAGNGGWGVRVVDLSTSGVSSWILPGLNARWSPDGSRIAIMPDFGDAIIIADPAGDTLQLITHPLGVSFGWQTYEQPFDWSPDGDWLIIRLGMALQLIQVETGLMLPLPWSTTIGQPAWRPNAP